MLILRYIQIVVLVINPQKKLLLYLLLNWEKITKELLYIQEIKYNTIKIQIYIYNNTITIWKKISC